MKRILVAMLALVATGATAQDKKFPDPEPMRAAMTEFWYPQPDVVTTDDFDDKMIAPPSDAIILYNGETTKEWVTTKGENIQWVSEGGVLTVKPRSGSIKTVREFDDFQLHIEWSAPSEVVSESQGRGNSGVFLQERYEVQMLDSYQNPTYSNGQAGSIYKQTPPLVNAMQKPGKWNVYDIIYTAPIFKNGKMVQKPRVTVLHNGVLVQNHTAILGTTEYIGLPKQTEHGKAPISLQDHGNETRFRNIWIREL